MRGTPGRPRTCALPVKSRLLYQLSYGGMGLPERFKLSTRGVEPTALSTELREPGMGGRGRTSTPGFGDLCSTIELRPCIQLLTCRDGLSRHHHLLLVGTERFELPTPWAQARCSTAELHPDVVTA